MSENKNFNSADSLLCPGQLLDISIRGFEKALIIRTHEVSPGKYKYILKLPNGDRVRISYEDLMANLKKPVGFTVIEEGKTDLLNTVHLSDADSKPLFKVGDLAVLVLDKDVQFEVIIVGVEPELVEGEYSYRVVVNGDEITCFETSLMKKTSKLEKNVIEEANVSNKR